MKITTRVLLIILSLLTHLTVKAQDFNNYTRILSSGTIPADFTTLSTQKYEQSKQQISSKSSHHEKKVQDQFYLESSFDIDDLLLSGDVVFNDPVSAYLNQLKNLLLKNDPLLRDSIRVYLLRSTDVNACTTNNGIILVNVGLIAQVENEAQLAYVLSHEIQHFRHKDNLMEYIENDKIENGKDMYKHQSANDAILSRFQYSKDIETRADLDGLDLYKTSDYSLDEVNKLFTVLEYADLPFDDIKFNKSYFERGNYVFPDKYFLTQTAPIPDDQDYDDSKSTHPNIKKRREDVATRLGTYDNAGRKKFIIKTKAEFENIQKTCRFETCIIQTGSSDYANAAYSAYLLMQHDSANKFLQKTMAQALYGLSQYKTNYSLELVATDYKKMYGSSQQLNYFLLKIPAHELAILALRYNLKLQEKYPNDPDLITMADDLFNTLAYHFNDKSSDFYSVEPKKAAVAVTVTDTTLSSTDSSLQTKYDKIKKMQKVEKDIVNPVYYKYAFTDLLTNKAISDTFNAEFNKHANLQDQRTETKKQMAKEQTIANKGYALGISKLNIVDPFYAKFDQTKKNSQSYIASEEAQQQLSNVFANDARLVGLNVNVMGTKSLDSTDVQKLNDISVLNQWISEKINHDNDNVNMAVSSTQNLRNIANHYDCDKFCWTGIVSTKEPKHAVPTLITTIIFFPLLPYGIYNIIQPNYYTNLYSLVVDASTGNVIMDYSHEIRMRDSKAVLNSNIYYMFQQIKTAR